ncbi:MAG: GIY-YIG nuclease family protein [Anaerolineae bacterium]|nr:GIY-YIG nuclease family protein [Anaerolineae bacterium]
MPYYVYIMTNHSRTLYTGVTNNLERRVGEHRSGTGSKFTSKYQITQLVYYESFSDVRQAIAREKQIKGLSRAKKLSLIVGQNPDWQDLSLGWSTPNTTTTQEQERL